MASKKTRIGYFGHAFGSIELHPITGVLAYRREHREIVLYDFSMTKIGLVEDSSAGPPWKGLVDGAILATGFRGDVESRLDWIARGGVPAVAVTSDLIDRRLPAVFTDPVSIARLATGELRRCHCRRMVYVGSQLSMASPLRAEAFRAAVERVGARFAAIDLPYGPEELLGLKNAKAHPELLDLLRPATEQAGPTGVFTLNDSLARFILRAVEAEGLDVPGQVALVSPDDTRVTFDRRPTITSIRSEGRETGYRAMELLVRQMTTGRRPRKPVLVPRKELVRRQTTGIDVGPEDLALALDLIRREACSGKSIDAIIDSLPLARRTLERRFRERLGRTPLQEIFRFRLAEAKVLLEDTEFTTARIAHRTGFHDHAALNKFFRDQTGMSPSEFRRQHRERANAV